MTLALPQLKQMKIQLNNASSAVENISAGGQTEASESWLTPFIAVLNKIGISRTPDNAVHASRQVQFSVAGELPIRTTSATNINFEVYMPRDDDFLIDERIPRIPIKSQTVKLKLQIGGHGKPAFRTMITESNIDE